MHERLDLRIKERETIKKCLENFSKDNELLKFRNKELEFTCQKHVE